MLKNTSAGTPKIRKEWIKPQKKEGLILIEAAVFIKKQSVPVCLKTWSFLPWLPQTVTLIDMDQQSLTSFKNHKKLKRVLEKCKDSLTFLTVSIPDSVWGRWVGVLQIYQNSKHLQCLQRLHLIVNLFTVSKYLRECELNYFFLMPRQLHLAWVVSISLSRCSSWDRNGLLDNNKQSLILKITWEWCLLYRQRKAVFMFYLKNLVWLSQNSL